MVDFYLFITWCNNYISKAEFHRVSGGGTMVMVVVVVESKMLLSTYHMSSTLVRILFVIAWVIYHLFRENEAYIK